MTTVREAMRELAEKVLDQAGAKIDEEPSSTRDGLSYDAERLARMVLDNCKRSVALGVVVPRGWVSPFWEKADHDRDGALAWAKTKAAELSTERSPLVGRVIVISLP